MTYQNKTVTLDCLSRADSVNARKSYDPAKVAELAASIAAKGILQPLVARPNGKAGHFEVVAGGRRLAALGQLAEAGTIDAATYEVPIRVGKLEDGEAHEVSTIENVVREDLDLVDEVEAFARMRADGMSSQEIAVHFGLPERRVRQRIALGALHPDIIEALRAEEIRLDTAQAFTLTDDQERQKRVFDQLVEQGHGVWAHNVRTLLSANTIRATSGLAEFVGEEEYLARGGTVTDDLFAESTLWDDEGLAYQIARERVAEQMDALKAEGWAWVRFSDEVDSEWQYRWGRVHADYAPTEEQQQRLDAIAARFAEIEEGEGDELTDDESAEWDRLDAEQRDLNEASHVFTDEQKAMAGCVVAVDSYGVNITKGVIHPEDAKALEKENGKAKAEDTGPKPYSSVLLNDLSHKLTAALQAQIAAKPALAEALLLARMVCDVRINSIYDARSLHVSVSVYHANAGTNPAIAELHTKLGDMIETAPEDSFEALVEYIAGMSAKDRRKLMALLVACCVDSSDASLGQHGMAPQRDGFVKAVNPDVGKVWKPDEAFFARLNKPQLLAAITEACGEAEASKHEKAKKSDLVATAERLVPPTGWLPEAARTPAYEAPQVS